MRLPSLNDKVVLFGHTHQIIGDNGYYIAFKNLTFNTISTVSRDWFSNHPGDWWFQEIASIEGSKNMKLPIVDDVIQVLDPGTTGLATLRIQPSKPNSMDIHAIDVNSGQEWVLQEDWLVQNPEHWNYYILYPDDQASNEGMPHECQFQLYNGFTETFEFCTVCDAKRKISA